MHIEKYSASRYDYSALLKSTAAKIWEKDGPRRRALVQLFLPGYENGEFLDVIPFIDWCISSGHTGIVFTPFNPFGYGECPFSAQSSFAKEPLFLSLRNLQGSQVNKYKSEIEQLEKDFPHGNKDLYNKAKRKEQIARLIFNDTATEKTHPDFIAFLEAKKYWIKDFVFYRSIKRNNEDKSWEDWANKDLSSRDLSALNHYELTNANDLIFHSWLQWQLYLQLSSVANYARERNFELITNTPFLAARDSADVWTKRHLGYFNESLEAGAPPDKLADGQGWGNPIILWENVIRDGFKYINERLINLEDHFTGYIIDHVFGLGRVWSIPTGKSPKEGFYLLIDPVGDEAIWDKQLRDLTQRFILASDVLKPLAENLGFGQKNCNEILAERGILGMILQRFERVGTTIESKEDEKPGDFIPPHKYKPLNAAAFGTHDVPFEARNYNAHLKQDERNNLARSFGIRNLASREINSDFMFDLIEVQAHGAPLWTFHHLHDILTADDPEAFLTQDSYINIPGTSSGNFVYSYPPQYGIEGLKNLTDLTQELLRINTESGRTYAHK